MASSEERWCPERLAVPTASDFSPGSCTIPNGEGGVCEESAAFGCARTFLRIGVSRSMVVMDWSFLRLSGFISELESYTELSTLWSCGGWCMVTGI